MKRITLAIVAVALAPTIAVAACPAGLNGKYLVSGVIESYDAASPQGLETKATLEGLVAFPTTASTMGSMQMSGWERPSILNAGLGGAALGLPFSFPGGFVFDPTTCTGLMTLLIPTGSTYKYRMIVTAGGTRIQWILFTTVNSATDTSGNYVLETITGQRR